VYRLLPGQDREVYEKFTITPRDGAAVLRLVAPLDYETKRLYEVIIEARDRAGTSEINSAQSVVIVKVRNKLSSNH
jgi:hypothetical protein